MTMLRSVMLGCGSYLPERVLSNEELAARVETSDEWIVQRTGIRQRHIAADGEVTSDLAIQAARAAGDLLRVDFHRPAGPRGEYDKSPADTEAEQRRWHHEPHRLEGEKRPKPPHTDHIEQA